LRPFVPDTALGNAGRFRLISLACKDISVETTPMRMEGKIALITGGGTGIGRATALAFAREGAKVTLMGRRLEPLVITAREIGSSALVVTGDLSSGPDIDDAIRSTVARFGGLNVLVNNGAVLHAGTAESHTEEEWDETFNINVKGLWMLSRAVLPHMRNAGGGSIVNLSSVLSAPVIVQRTPHRRARSLY
jgi:NAD(P)-dependent dehydrogenase (short-subunit alcohol dehydrogenase family)